MPDGPKGHLVIHPAVLAKDGTEPPPEAQPAPATPLPPEVALRLLAAGPPYLRDICALARAHASQTSRGYAPMRSLWLASNGPRMLYSSPDGIETDRWTQLLLQACILLVTRPDIAGADPVQSDSVRSAGVFLAALVILAQPPTLLGMSPVAARLTFADAEVLRGVGRLGEEVGELAGAVLGAAVVVEGPVSGAAHVPGGLLKPEGNTLAERWPACYCFDDEEWKEMEAERIELEAVGGGMRKAVEERVQARRKEREAERKFQEEAERLEEAVKKAEESLRKVKKGDKWKSMELYKADRKEKEAEVSEMEVLKVFGEAVSAGEDEFAEIWDREGDDSDIEALRQFAEAVGAGEATVTVGGTGGGGGGDSNAGIGFPIP